MAYNGDGTSTATDAAGGSRTYTLSLVQMMLRAASVTGTPCNVCRDQIKAYGYDANGNVNSKTDFNNVSTTYQYDQQRNLETYRSEASRTSAVRNTSTYWHATYRLPTSIQTSYRKTSFTYDSAGNMLTRTLQDLQFSISRTWTYTYDSYGRVLTADGRRQSSRMSRRTCTTRARRASSVDKSIPSPTRLAGDDLQQLQRARPTAHDHRPEWRRHDADLRRQTAPHVAPGRN